jgi:uncharacterized C2H2 Zn-finger protein
MSLWVEPRNPISYKFMCGTRDQTGVLASLFIKEMRMSLGNVRSDARFHGALTNGAGNIGMVVSKRDDDSFSHASSSDGAAAAASGGQTPLQHHDPRLQFEPQLSPGAIAAREPLSLAAAAAAAAAAVAAAAVGSNVTISDVAWVRPFVDSMGPHATGLAGVAMREGSRRPQHLQHLQAQVQPRVQPRQLSEFRDADPAYLYQQGVALQDQPPVAADDEHGAGRHQHGDGMAVQDQLQPPQRQQRQLYSIGGSDVDEAPGRCRAGGSGHAAGEASGGDGGVSRGSAASGGTDDAASSGAQQTHIITGPNGMPTCSECGASFRKTGNLTRHIQTVHLKKRPFACDQCTACFGYKTHLNRHVQTVHNKSSDFQCPDCNREFRTSQQLDRHQHQAHWGTADGDSAVEEIKCEVCGHGFSQRSNLNRHMQSIHQGLRHTCSVCPSSFGQRFDLQRHIQRLVENGDAAHAQIALSASHEEPH